MLRVQRLMGGDTAEGRLDLDFFKDPKKVLYTIFVLCHNLS